MLAWLLLDPTLLLDLLLQLLAGECFSDISYIIY
jgi:hypothetical protein